MRWIAIYDVTVLFGSYQYLIISFTGIPIVPITIHWYCVSGLVIYHSYKACASFKTCYVLWISFLVYIIHSTTYLDILLCTRAHTHACIHACIWLLLLLTHHTHHILHPHTHTHTNTLLFTCRITAAAHIIQCHHKVLLLLIITYYSDGSEPKKTTYLKAYVVIV